MPTAHGLDDGRLVLPGHEDEVDGNARHDNGDPDT